MIDSIGTILAALSAIIAVGAIIVGGVLWASRRRIDAEPTRDGDS